MTLDPSDGYRHPLGLRYTSKAMQRIFSDRFRFSTWRRLWLALAESQRELGLDISSAQIDGIRERLDDLNLPRAQELERELRHDVMAHVHVLREQCPEAGRIVHLGATSCYVTDNSELVQIRDGLRLLLRKLRVVIGALRDFAMSHRSRPTVGYTHFQPAQLTTVGKRASLWLQDLVDDHDELEHVSIRLRFRGVKGTTGTQDSFLKLFDGDHEKVKALDAAVCRRMGFANVWAVCGQTYPRKQDSRVLEALSGLAQSAGKMASDLRLLAHLQEVEEPFEERQIGSSAMPYKRNPMRSERMTALARWLMVLAQNAPHTAATQWLERSLDDSANRRLTLSEGFLAADALLEILLNLTSGLVVQESVIARNVAEKLPFIASEEILMAAVKAGGDRQELHEILRQAALRASQELKTHGGKNRFLDFLAETEDLAKGLSALGGRLDPTRFVGRAPEQVEDFVRSIVDPLLQRFSKESIDDEVSV